MRRQALGSATYHDGDGIPGTERKNIGAGGFGDGGNAVDEEEISVEGELKVGLCT